jgi:AAA domain
MASDSKRFVDVDGTQIIQCEPLRRRHSASGENHRLPHFRVSSPDGSEVTVTLSNELDASEATSCCIEWLMSCCTGATALQLRVLPAAKKLVACGVDVQYGTDGKLTTLQLCIGNHCLILNGSGFQSPELRRLLSTAATGSGSQFPLLFVGTELASKALHLWQATGIALHHCLDLTPLLSEELMPVAKGLGAPKATRPAVGSELTSGSLLLGSPLARLGVRQMLNALMPELKKPWEKDKQVANSDWSSSPLSLQQVKHAALEAWASRVVGEYAASLHPRPGCKRRYKLQLCPEQLLGLPMPAGAEALMSGTTVSSDSVVDISPFSLSPLAADPSKPLPIIAKLANETESLEKAQKREHAVVVTSIERPERFSPRSHVTLRMGSYDKRLRNRGPAEFFLYAFPPDRRALSGVGGHGTSRGGKPPLIWRVEGEVVEVRGKNATVRLHAATARAGPAYRGKVDEGGSVDVDGLEIIRMWGEKRDNLQIRTNNHSESDLPLGRASCVIKALIRCCNAYAPTPVRVFGIPLPAFSSGSTLEDLVKSVPGAMAWRLFFKMPLPPLASWNADAATALFKRHDKQLRLLNESQKKAFVNAHSYPVSVIRGPPGTGKTRTVAAITESFVDDGKRVMLIAPANAGTKRLLSAVKDHGYHDVCLLLSTEFFASWSELNYAGSLAQVVNEVLVDDDKLQQVDGRAEAIARRSPAMARAAGLLSREQIEQARDLSLWVNAEKKQAKGTPPVVVMTFGAASVAEARISPWHAGLVSQLVQWENIDVVIVDEASQLWEGHAATLTTMFPKATTMVVVGDDKQLPPFGSSDNDAGKGARSLFECVATQPRGSVPLTQLNISYRLPSEIGTLLSSSLYGGDLRMQRNPLRDTVIRRHLLARLQGGADALAMGREPCGVASDVRSPLIGPLLDHWPLFWADMKDPHSYRSGDTNSWASDVEAEAVAQAAVDILIAIDEAWTSSWGKKDLGSLRQHLATTLVGNGGTAAENKQALDDACRLPTLVIISPYAEQQRRIQQALAEAMVATAGRESIEAAFEEVSSRRLVANIDGFQGQEADFTLLSYVRQNGLGFLSDDRRANVMLSRTLQGSLLVGNINALATADKGAPEPLLVSKFARYCIDSGRTKPVGGASGSSGAGLGAAVVGKLVGGVTNLVKAAVPSVLGAVAPYRWWANKHPSRATADGGGGDENAAPVTAAPATAVASSAGAAAKPAAAKPAAVTTGAAPPPAVAKPAPAPPAVVAAPPSAPVRTVLAPVLFSNVQRSTNLVAAAAGAVKSSLATMQAAAAAAAKQLAEQAKAKEAAAEAERKRLQQEKEAQEAAAVKAERRRRAAAIAADPVARAASTTTFYNRLRRVIIELQAIGKGISSAWVHEDHIRDQIPRH